MLVKVFVLGRPGSGKTTAVKRIQKYAESHGYSMRRFKDYKILYEMYREDMERQIYENSEPKFRSAERGGFDVLHLKMFDVALKRLEKDVEDTFPFFRSEKNVVVTIEFARNDYQDALSEFSTSFLRDAYFLFVDCELKKCIERIKQRSSIEPELSEKPESDTHFVSEYIMRTYYNYSSIIFNQMVRIVEEKLHTCKAIQIINNTDCSIDTFNRSIDSFAEALSIREEVLVG